jgi:hypothetical protein
MGCGAIKWIYVFLNRQALQVIETIIYFCGDGLFNEAVSFKIYTV